LSIDGKADDGISIQGISTTATRAFFGLDTSGDGYLSLTNGGTFTKNVQLTSDLGVANYIMGNVGIGTTTPAVKLDVIGAIRSSAGILFGTDTAAVNTLDDYEEGTWTPKVFDANSGGNEATYSQNEGVYTKIGNMVYWRISIVLASKGSMTAGNELYIRDFPFTSASIPGNWYNPSSVLTWGATFADYLVFHQQGGTTWGYLYEVTSGGNGGALLVSDYTATAAITATGFYRV
jgi:hypothetical protein